MPEEDQLAQRFEEHRAHLRSVAHRILGSATEADDAVQGTWLRLRRTEASGIRNFGGWLTTAVAREALDLLRARTTRREQSLDGHIPDPIVLSEDADPERSALLADSVDLALHVVLESLSPAERVAFVLHDVFAMSFAEVAQVLERTPDAARQLASRGRRRVRAAPIDRSGGKRHRSVVDAFFVAARHGDLEALLAVLDPEAVLRVDGGAASRHVVKGAEAVAQRALHFADPERRTHSVSVNGQPGVVVTVGDNTPVSVMSFEVRDGRIQSIDSLVDPDRLRTLTLPIPHGASDD